MGNGRRSFRLEHPLLAGLRELPAAFVPSNVSRASPISECGWGLFETTPSRAPTAQFDFDDAGTVAPAAFRGAASTIVQRREAGSADVLRARS